MISVGAGDGADEREGYTQVIKICHFYNRLYDSLVLGALTGVLSTTPVLGCRVGSHFGFVRQTMRLD